MREDAKKGVYVENLSEVEVQCVQDVIQLLLQVFHPTVVVMLAQLLRPVE